ncbi:MAG: hypothetical protein HFACDABA_01694 [Anaerolineales bacterium]|nr:hypothetical protein [Anaerolineales bacterium]
MITKNSPGETLKNHIARFWRFLTDPHPSVTEVGERRRAQLLSTLSVILSLSFTWALLSRPSALFVFMFFLGLTLTAYISSRTRFYRLGAYIIAFGFTSIAYINIYNGEASSIDNSVLSIVPISLILASALLSQGEFLFLMIVTVFATASVRAYAPAHLINDPAFSYGRTLGVTFSTGFILFGISAFRAASERARLKEAQTVNTELQALTASLEDRVNERTQALALVAEISAATASILEFSRLLQAVTNLTKERFNLYHAHIYLLDEEGKNLNLSAGAGEAGRVMVSEKHSIPLSREQSLVARAARERKGVIVNDVTQAPDFQPNPLLPDTRSELAVPMIFADRVIGVFDIQSERAGRFTESDANIQTALAAQLASSIQNARSFEESRAQAKLEALVNLIGQKIQRAATVEETLQTAARELGNALGAQRVQAVASARARRAVSMQEQN